MKNRMLPVLTALMLAAAPIVPIHAATTQAAKPAADIPEKDLPLDPRFSADRIKADVTFLADDLLEGRDIGSPGHEIAALYAAQQFAALGLKPMGENGTFYQRIPFQRTSHADAPAGLEVSGPGGSKTFAHGVGSLVSLNPLELDVDVSAPMVFVGYGIVNERFGIDDYKGLDVKGKIVVVLSGFPADLPSEPAAYMSSSKYEVAAKHGAVGFITLPTATSQKVRSWERRIRYAHSAKVSWVGPDGKPFVENPELHVAASVDDPGAAAIFAGAPRTFAAVKKEADRKGARPRGFALKTTARIYAPAKAEQITSPNVIAMLPGSDPELAAQYVVLSAHLDHLGKRELKEGEAADTDLIFNGAMDNAAGSATTLEVARVLAADKVAPRRSVIFLISTGEEKGLLGAEYFAKNPTVPEGSIVGDVDLDMPLLFYPFTDVVAYGAEHSTLGKQVAEAVAPMKIVLSPDPQPEQTIFVRSDHYEFVKEGIPAVFLSTGMANGGDKAWPEFLAKNYHDPSDEVSDKFDWRAGARFAEANYRITRAMADADAPPRWFEGDFFGDLFAPDAEKVAEDK